MSRLPLVDSVSATPEVRVMLESVQVTLGATPNFTKVLANAPTALRGFLGLFVIAGEGALPPAVREQIALVVAETNGCDYCLAAHTVLAKGAGLDEAEIMAARQGAASGSKAQAAVRFARDLVQSMGEVSAAQFDAARAVLSDEELLEVIAHVALNIFTNLIGKATQVNIDFPRVRSLAAA